MANKINDDVDKAFEVIMGWPIKDYPGFSEWKSESVRAILDYGEPWYEIPDDHPEEFAFPDHINRQHAAVTAFHELYLTWQAIADTEFYFRRYPFRNLPVSFDTHLRYTCETYFSRIYEFSERLKECLNAINGVIKAELNVGAFVDLFKKEFRDEIKMRNQIHHRTRFEEITIDRIMFEGLMAVDRGDGHGDRGWKAEQRRTYRKASKEWAERAKRRSIRVREYLNGVARIIVTECSFLAGPLELDLA